MTTDLATLETRILQIAPITTVEDIATAINDLGFMKRRCAELQSHLEERMIERINETGQDVVIGTVRYYVGVAKSVKCKDVPATIEQVLSAANGDVARFADCLSSGAFKYGTVRRLFEEVGDTTSYGQLFETVEKDDLKEGKPVKRLQKVDEQFIR